MRLVDKYPLDRMRDKQVKLSFQCPYCRSTRIEMTDAEDLSFWKGVSCSKCKALVVLDALSVVVIRERMAQQVRQTQ